MSEPIRQLEDDTLFVETESSDTILFVAREDGDFYVETRGLGFSSISNILNRDEAMVLATWIMNKSK